MEEATATRFKGAWIPRGRVQEMEMDGSVKNGEEMMILSGGTFQITLKPL